MYWERDVQVKQEQMKDRLRRREEAQMLAGSDHPKPSRSRWQAVVTAVFLASRFFPK